jgi:hypothetical protein
MHNASKKPRKQQRTAGRASHRLILTAWAVGVLLTAGASGGARAMPVDTGDDDLKLNFDNTVKYSAAWRVKEQSAGLLGNANNDDGDRNFDRGLVSNRVDWLSELDLVYAKRFGLRLSGAAWYDQVYNTHNDNPGFAGGASPNQASVAYNQFTAATKRLHGRKTDLLDAFVFGSFDLGEQRASVRLGRHTLVWGESLFLGVNAIAGGMSPVDAIKLSSVPNTQFKEAIRPVPQVSGSVQLTPSLSLGAYYQFKWEANRLPAVGSYFSGLDTNPDGAEQLLLGPGVAASRLADQKAKDRGQGGVQLRLRAGETDYGLYLIRFHSKVQQQVSVLGVTPGGVAPTAYRLAYHEGVTALGASASRTFGDLNVAIEGSLRRNQDLASSQAADASGLAPPGVIAATDNRDNPGYAVGKTAHVNVNALWSLPPTPLFAEGNLAAEVAWNRVLAVTKNAAALDPNATRDAYALRVQVEPLYRQVTGGWDLGVPLGLGYSPRGSRSMALGPAWTPENGGDLTLGLNATYLDAWRFSLAYTHYFGREATFITSANTFSYGQYLKDRDFVAFSVRRTF